MKIKKQLAYLIKAIGTITVESLPELVELVPGYGTLLGKILSKVLAVADEHQDEMTEDNINKQIDLLKEAIQNNRITEDNFKEMFQKEVVDYFNSCKYRDSAYMFGVILYPFEFMNIAYDDIKEIEEVFSSEYEIQIGDEWEYMCSFKERIKEFCGIYVANHSLTENEDYYIRPDCLIINFNTDTEMHRRNDEKIIDFIENLNGFLGKKLFGGYFIF